MGLETAPSAPKQLSPFCHRTLLLLFLLSPEAQVLYRFVRRRSPIYMGPYSVRVPEHMLASREQFLKQREII